MKNIKYSLILFALGLTACGDGFRVSHTEQKALSQMAFVGGGEDSIPVGNPETAGSIEQVQLVKPCSAGKAQAEYQRARARASADPMRRTLPVRFTFSFGTASDSIAAKAHNSAILSKSGNGKIRLDNIVDPSRGVAVSVTADYVEAKRQFVSGEACNYSTVTVDREFGALPVDVVDIPVADLREARLRTNDPVIKVDFESLSAPRNTTMTFKYADLINIGEIIENRQQITNRYETPYINPAFGETLNPYEGVSQMLENIISNTSENYEITGSYTPLVLDLGDLGIRTSSLRFGIFFDVAGISSRHATAWLGGVIKNVGSLAKPYFQRVAEDGLLVLDAPVPTANAPVQLDARHLLGEGTKIDGRSFSNGFDALINASGKNCQAQTLRSGYVGPWDSDLYFKRLKVWIDKNRNGVTEFGELISLSDAKVAAINVCHTVEANAHDSFGNDTSMRSAYLKLEAGEDPALSSSIGRIEDRLKAGQGEFRLLVDVKFVGDIRHTLH